MGRLLATLMILWGFSAAALAEPAAGVVARELPDQVGVYELKPAAGELQAGDIVTLLRNGQPVGEAVVLPGSSGRPARIMTKGVAEAMPGDQARFARRPVPQAAMRRTPGAAPAADPSQPAWLTPTRGTISVTESGQVRVDVCVRNEGGQRSRPRSVQCRWETVGGQAGVVDSLDLPALEPGESVEFTLVSTVRANPTAARTMGDTVPAEGRGILRPVLVVPGQSENAAAASSLPPSSSRWSEPANFPPPGSGTGTLGGTYPTGPIGGGGGGGG